MNIFAFIKTFFAEPTFFAGERVNHIRHGAIERTDGYVIGNTVDGVLVEWPRGGSTLIPVTELSVIG